MDSLVPSMPTEGSVTKKAALQLLFCPLALMATAPAPAQTEVVSGKQQGHAAFAAKGLPPGIGIDPTTGAISGTVDRAAIVDGKMIYDAQISVQDVNGAHGQFTIKIVLPNEPPFAGDDLAVVKSGELAIVSVLDNDIDLDGDDLVLLWAESRQSNLVSLDGPTIRFKTAGTGQLEDVVTYAISDGHGGKAVGHVRVLMVQ